MSAFETPPIICNQNINIVYTLFVIFCYGEDSKGFLKNAADKLFDKKAVKQRIFLRLLLTIESESYFHFVTRYFRSLK